MNELMIPVGVGLVSATWQWFRHRSAGRQWALDQSWRPADTGLPARGGPAESITEERSAAAAVVGATEGPHEVTFRTRSGEHTVQVAGKTLLQAAREAKLPLASLCERGVCGTCKVRLCSGAVEASAARALSAQQRAEGYVLACVSRPTSTAVVDLETEHQVRQQRRQGSKAVAGGVE